MTRDQGQQLSIDRCDPATYKEALALAAQAWPEAERAGYWQAIRSLVSQGDGDQANVGPACRAGPVLPAVRNPNRLLAAQVAQVLPGSVAVVWSPQFEPAIPSEQLHLAAALFVRMNHELQKAGAQMAQALVVASD